MGEGCASRDGGGGTHNGIGFPPRRVGGGVDGWSQGPQFQLIQVDEQVLFQSVS